MAPSRRQTAITSHITTKERQIRTMVLRVRWRLVNFIAVLIALCVGVVTGPLYALTAAHTQIENRAEAMYLVDGLNRMMWSNEVSVAVRQVAALEIGPGQSGGTPGDEGFVPADERSAIPNQRIMIPYRLTNTGNGADTFHLSVTIDESNAAGPGSLIEPVIYLDLSGDGIVDADDPRVTQITLDAKESVSLIVSVRTGSAVIEGDQLWLALNARSQFDPECRKSSWSLINIASEGPVIIVSRSTDIVRNVIQTFSVSSLGFGSNGNIAEQGDRLVHTLSIDNVGYGKGNDIVIYEPIASSESLILHTYGPWQPVLVSGTPITLGGNTGNTAELITEADGTVTLRLVLSEIEPTQRILVQYEVDVDWKENEQEIFKNAVVSYDYKPGVRRQVRSNDVVVKKEINYAVQVVPLGGSNVPGAPNLQRKNRVYAGQSVAFGVTVQNTGLSTGVIELSTAERIPQGWSVQFFQPDGKTPLVDTNLSGTVDVGTLQKGESRDVQVLVTTPQDESLFATSPHIFEVIAFYAEAPNQSDTTLIEIREVRAVSHLWDPLYMTVNPPGVTTPGTVLTYELVFGNASELDADNVVIVQNLSHYLYPPEILGGEIIPLSLIQTQMTPASSVGPMSLASENEPLNAAADGILPLDAAGGVGIYDPDKHAIVWTIPSVGAFQGGKLLFQATVTEDTPEGGIIEVQGMLTSNVSTAVAVSNIVTNIVLAKELMVDITSQFPVVAIGDINGVVVDVKYLDPLAKLHDVQLTVDLPAGLSYRKGTAKFNGTPIDDPKHNLGQLLFTISELEKDQRAQITFDTMVNAAADYEMEIFAKAEVQTGPNDWVVSEIASTRVLVVYGVLGDHGIIVGRLTTRDAVDLDAPGVAGVRVYLDNGRYAVSDKDGRFSFASVRPGPRVLRIDPSTLSDNERVTGGFSPDQATMKRVIVPAGGIAMVDVMLVPSEIMITTSERVAEGNNR